MKQNYFDKASISCHEWFYWIIKSKMKMMQELKNNNFRPSWNRNSIFDQIRKTNLWCENGYFLIKIISLFLAWKLFPILHFVIFNFWRENCLFFIKIVSITFGAKIVTLICNVGIFSFGRNFHENLKDYFWRKNCYFWSNS